MCHSRLSRHSRAGAIHYYFSDHLGTHGVVENQTASACEQDIDYYPYGGMEHDYCANVAQNYKFTGKERDTESGLDNFGARFDASSLGRFMSPDWAEDPDSIPYADLEDPQSLNLYSYVRNSAISSKDDDGHTCKQDPKTGNIKCEVDAPADAHVTTIPQAFWPEAIGVGRTITVTTIAVPVIVLTYLVNPPSGGNGNYRDTTDAPGGQTATPNPDDKNKKVKRVSNPKHNQNSKSPEPKNAQELFDRSIADNKGVRWAKDSDGTIHRFSAPSNGESHWNGSTAGSDPIRENNIPIEIRRALN